MPPKASLQLDIMFEHAFWGYFIPSKASFSIFSGVNLLFFIVSSRSDPKVKHRAGMPGTIVFQTLFFIGGCITSVILKN